MATTENQPNGTILIVDDDPDSTKVVTRLLAKNDYNLLTANSGPEALEVLAREDVDVILLDVMMPGMSGLEVCEKIRENNRYAELQIILLTGLDDFKTRHQGMKLGVSEFLCKPFTRTELFKRIEAQLRVRRITRELGAVETSI